MRNIKKVILTAVTGILIAGSALTASAASIGQGQWCTDAARTKWWFKLNASGTEYVANKWSWIQDSDGVIRCYYFDENGWMVSDKTIGSDAVNKDGQWIVNGQIQTAAPTEQAFYTSGKLAAAATSGASIVAPKTTTTGTKASTSKAYKASGKGDNPANATFTTAYTSSTISGKTATNKWAGFSMNFNGMSGCAVTSDNSGDATDFYATMGEAELYNMYFSLDQYKAGNTSLSAFIAAYNADKRGFGGGTNAGAVTLGGLSFTKLQKQIPDPTYTMYDCAYIREIPGTGLAQVIVVHQNGENQDFMAALKTIAKV